MMGQGAPSIRRTHAPDPVYFTEGCSALPSEAFPKVATRTGGCNDIVARKDIAENPADVTCHRCKRFLFRTAQFYNLLHNRWRQKELAKGAKTA